MDIREKERIERLKAVFENNFRLTKLYATYLERCPELITKEMITALTEDGEMSAKDAIVAILCEAFGIDGSEGGEPLRFIRNYIIPSVRILDAQKYYENPYYKNVKIEDKKLDRWELKQECYPAYRAFIAADMVEDGYLEYAPLGFFSEDFRFPAVLEDGNEWMTLTPVDLDTCDEAIEKARGKVVTFGLGLGYFAYMAARKEEVDSVTVVERDDKVIKLFESLILPQFPMKEKIRIVRSDALEYFKTEMPKERFDYAFIDIWRDASDGAPVLREMKPLEHLCEGTEFDYWIEGFLRSRLRALRFAELCDKIDDGAEDAPRSFEEFTEELDKLY